MAGTTAEEKKLTLPSGHPQHGYVSPDLSFTDSAGTVPPEEQEWNEARDEAREDEADAVAAQEDKVARAEAKGEDAEPRAKATPAKAAS